MTRKIIFATNNPGKLNELKEMLRSESVELYTLSDLGLILHPEETGSTFEENAAIKAEETAAFLKKHGHENVFVLADDSGLEIDAMDGAPGVDTAVYLGANATYPTRFAQIFEDLAGVPDEKRTARFVCVIACVLPGGEVITTRGTAEGTITRNPQGTGGFGYDPIFFVPEYGKTMAELPQNEKNKISHRGRALRAMVKKLENISCK